MDIDLWRVEWGRTHRRMQILHVRVISKWNTGASNRELKWTVEWVLFDAFEGVTWSDMASHSIDKWHVGEEMERAWTNNDREKLTSRECFNIEFGFGQESVHLFNSISTHFHHLQSIFIRKTNTVPCPGSSSKRLLFSPNLPGKLWVWSFNL